MALGLVTSHEDPFQRHERRWSLNPFFGVYILYFVEVYVHFHMEAILPTWLYVRAGCPELGLSTSACESESASLYNETCPSALLMVSRKVYAV